MQNLVCRLLITALLFFFATTAFGQIQMQKQNLRPALEDKGVEEINPIKLFCKKNHSSPWRFTSDIGLYTPVSIVNFTETKTGADIEWIHFDTQEIPHGFLKIEKGFSQLHTEVDEKNHSGCYAILYCRTHLEVVTLDLLPKEQCKDPEKKN